MSIVFIKSLSTQEKRIQKVSTLITKYTTLAKTKFSVDLGTLQHEYLTNTSMSPVMKEFVEKFESELKKASEIDKDNKDTDLQEMFKMNLSESKTFRKYSEVIIFLSMLEDSDITYIEEKNLVWNKLKDFFTLNKDGVLILN